MNKEIQKITDRIKDRSAKTRAAYLDLMKSAEKKQSKPW